ncbi:kinesin motor domain-containing protein [Ditylenchus destructor]|uniref:Kinesin-like protein n=1 Tax=Ditylenchus destructor TaxID=166010 RepID=A0AAD4NDR7_9BILA|nr:kinesin motor domain-containing protein [Ditylenchus destructor]
MATENSVRVAVRIRPQSAKEKAEKACVCTSVVPGVPQVVIGNDRAFTYDHVFDIDTAQETIYEQCVNNLVSGTFSGYNATVLAYGQTGSGKTYTMGTSFESTYVMDHTIGIIPRAASHLFCEMKQRERDAQGKGQMKPTFDVLAQFIELYNEEIIDLLAEERKPNSIKIHEDTINGEIYLKGVTQVQVYTAQEIMDVLKNGSLKRTTAETNMNQASSRSHAIFSLLIKQKKMASIENVESMEDDGAEEIKEVEVLSAKFHFVDLAGSERLKRTGATGDRQKEGISINCGLLALGNVISALGQAKGKAAHVPYRDSKLTRLLQDSLGGNSCTLMIACASPSDIDFVETLNTLNYANRAKNIKNRIVANQGKSSSLTSELRARIVALEEELKEYKQGKRLVGEHGKETFNDQYLENVSLNNENQRLRTQVKALSSTIEVMKAHAIQLQQKFATAKLSEMDDCDGGASAIEMNPLRSCIEEMETMRTQLIEARATIDELRKQSNRYKAMAASGNYASPSRSLGLSTPLIKAAKRDIRKQKKLLAQMTEPRTGNNIVGDADNNTASTTIVTCNTQNSDMSTSDEESENYQTCKEYIRTCNDFVIMQEEICIREQLIEELEHKERHLAQMRKDYEHKLQELTERITAIEAERDKVIADIAAKPDGRTKQAEEKIQRIREDYENKLNTLRSESKKVKGVEREYARLQVQHNKCQEEIRKYQTEIADMKRTKVEVMKKLKEESKRARMAERENMKKVASLEKIARQHENQIRQLKNYAANKDDIIKRKNEECKKLREKQKEAKKGLKRRSRSHTNATANNHHARALSIPVKHRGETFFDRTFLMSPLSSPDENQFIDDGKNESRKQEMDDKMHRLIKERSDLRSDLLKLYAQAGTSPEEEMAINEQRDSTKVKLDYIQSEIRNLQSEMTDLNY